MVPTVELDRDDRTPLFIQLADALREQIRSGAIAPRHAVPSKARLCQEFDISTKTVDKAMGILKAEGLIEAERGKGLFVTERKRWRKGHAV